MMFAIDCHDHIYIKRLAPKAVQSVGEFYQVKMACSGVSDELVEIAGSSPVKRFVVNAVAPGPSSVKRLNDFMAKEKDAHPEFTALGTLHPDMEDVRSETDRIISLGLKGIKLHPDSQGFEMDCPEAMRIYEAAEGRLPVLMHCGDYRYDSSHPRRLVNILKAFPGLTVVAAHLGGWSIFEEAVPYMKELDCYMDISSTMPFIGGEKTLEYIRMYSADRLLFGSDFPMWSPVSEFDAFMRLELSEEEQRKILYKNAASVFDIDVSGLEE